MKYGHKIHRDNPSYCYSTQNVATDFEETDGKDSTVHEHYSELDYIHGGREVRMRSSALLKMSN